MKVEVRVFRHDKAAPVHTAQFGENEAINFTQIAHDNNLGRPLRTTDDGELYENGEIKIVTLGKDK